MTTTPPHGQYRHAQFLVDNVHAGQGFYPGFRAVHALGRFYRGTFTASGDGAALTRAAHFQPNSSVPVTARFSAVASDPEAPFSPIVAMATKFYLDNGTATDMISTNLTLFPFSNTDEPVALASAPDQAAKDAYLAANPKLAAALQTMATLQAPKSLAETAYNALHAYWFENAAGERRAGRYRWEPEVVGSTQTKEELQAQPQDALFTELETRLDQNPVRFALYLSLAEPEDDINDVRTPWPEDRERVLLGHLALQRRTSEAELGNPIMIHDPTRLTDGIDVTDDPILNARRGIYEVSAANRGANWKTQQAAAARDNR